VFVLIRSVLITSQPSLPPSLPPSGQVSDIGVCRRGATVPRRGGHRGSSGLFYHILREGRREGGQEGGREGGLEGGRELRFNKKEGEKEEEDIMNGTF